MEMYQAIVKMEQDGTDENLQVFVLAMIRLMKIVECILFSAFLITGVL